MDLRLRDVLTAGSCLKYKLWEKIREPGPLSLRMASGTRVLIRPDPASDFNVFYEVFVKRVYDPPMALDRNSVHLVVDLGANVGFSNLFWLEIFPNTQVLTYEPHPVHIDLAHRNFGLNRTGGRIVLRAAAAGTSDGGAFLTDHGSESELSDESAGAIRVPILDFFKDLPHRPIDVLKIDIEGGEFALVLDPRFQRIRPRVVCMEAHPHKRLRLDQAAALSFWRNHWDDSGYQTEICKGILWATRA